MNRGPVDQWVFEELNEQHSVGFILEKCTTSSLALAKRNYNKLVRAATVISVLHKTDINLTEF